MDYKLHQGSQNPSPMSLVLEEIQAKPVRGQCDESQIDHDSGLYEDPITGQPLPRYAVRVRVEGSPDVKECYAFARRIDADGEDKRNAAVRQRWDEYARDH